MMKGLRIRVRVPESYVVYVNRWTGIKDFLFRRTYEYVDLGGMEQAEVSHPLDV